MKLRKRARKADGPEGEGRGGGRRGGRGGRGEGRGARWEATTAARAWLGSALDADRQGRADLANVDWSRHFEPFGETPRRLVQFWDRDPPEEVAAMFRQTRQMLDKAGYEHLIFDLQTARERIAETAGDAWVDHYDRAPHPSMQADIFRIVELHGHGGMYMDADMVLKAVIPFPPPQVPLFVQWNLGERKNVANWFLSSPAGHPLYASILERIDARLGTLERDAEGRYVSVNLIPETGPGQVSNAIEEYLRARGDVPPDIAIMTVAWSREFVQPARFFLEGPVPYKRSGLHWRKGEK